MTRRRRKRAMGVFEIYPSEYAPRGKRYGHPETREHARHGEDADTRAVRCAQCGAPIEDRTAQANCWLCGSDNFEGHRY